MLFVPPVRHLLRAKTWPAPDFEPLSVDDPARAAGLSRAHFSREFRRAFGEPPRAYLFTRRLERAAALLRTTDRSVVEIPSVGLRSLGSSPPASPHVRHAADRVPDLPAGLHVRVDPDLCRARLRATATQHVSRRQRLQVPSLASVTTLGTEPRRHDDQALDHAGLWVHDQDEALSFDTDKLGFEVRADVTVAELGNFRWLTVGPAGQPDIAVVLMSHPRPARNGRRDRLRGPGR